MMSLCIEPAVPTILLGDSSPDLQQLAILVNSIIHHIQLISFVVDLDRLLATARECLDKEGKKIEELRARTGPKRPRRTTWFISTILKTHIGEAVSEPTSEYSIWQDLYNFTGSLRGVVVLHLMLVNSTSKESEEVLKTISLWPVVGRKLFAILLAKLEMHKGIVHALEWDWEKYEDGADGGAPHSNDSTDERPPPMRFESDKHSRNPNSSAEVSLEVQALAGTGREMVVARVKESKGHILQTLLSDPKQSQTQTLPGLGAQGRSGGQERGLVSMTHAPATPQQRLPSQPQPQLPQNPSSGQSLLPISKAVPGSKVPGSEKDLRRVDMDLDSGPLCDSLSCIMSGKLSESLRRNMKKNLRDFLQSFMSEKLNIFLPPDEPETEPGAASKELPVIMRIRSEMEFHFTKETTRHLMRSKLGANAEYQQLHSLTWEDLFGYLEKSLNRETKLKATGMISQGTITIFIQKTIEGSLFEVTIQFARTLFWVIAKTLEPYKMLQ